MSVNDNAANAAKDLEKIAIKMKEAADREKYIRKADLRFWALALQLVAEQLKRKTE